MLLLAQSGLEEGIWLRAERQTGGRGRLGRAWEGQEGNLYASTLVRRRPSDPHLAGLALVAGVAAHDALSRLAAATKLTLKWPNDILAEGAKLSGLLLEATGNAVVVGIGVNVTHHPVLADRATTCLHALGARAITAQQVAETLAHCFAYWLSVWRGQGFSAIREAWIERAHGPDTPLRANLPDGTSVDGRFETLDNDGNLILRLANGERRVIHAGDIFLL